MEDWFDATSVETFRDDLVGLKQLLDSGYKQYLKVDFGLVSPVRVVPQFIRFLFFLSGVDLTGEADTLEKERTDSDGENLFSSCGKLITTHAVYFRCSKCGLSSGSVFCIDCFVNSPCRYHDYRLGFCTSTDGYCDCGDDSSWTEESFCTVHRTSRMSARENSGTISAEAETLEQVVFFFVVRAFSAEALSIAYDMSGGENDGKFKVWKKRYDLLYRLLYRLKSKQLCNVIAEAFSLPIVPEGLDESECPLVTFYRERKIKACVESLALLLVFRKEVYGKSIFDFVLRFSYAKEFRVLCLQMYSKYASLALYDIAVITLNRYTLDRLCSFSNPLMVFPDHPEWQHETLIHRTARNSLSELYKKRSTDLPPFSAVDYIFRIKQSETVQLHSLGFLGNVFEGGPEGSLGFTISGCFIRAFLMYFEILSANDKYCLDPQEVDFFAVQSSTSFLQMAATDLMQEIMKQFYSVASALRPNTTYADIAKSFDANPRLLDTLKLIRVLSSTAEFDGYENGDVDFRHGFSELISSTHVPTPVLLPSEESLRHNAATKSDLQLEYFLVFGELVMRSLINYLRIQSIDFCCHSDDHVLLSRDPKVVPDVRAYNALPPHHHSISLFNGVLAMFARFVRLWLPLEKEDKGCPSVKHLVSELFKHFDHSAYEQHLLDSCVMPFVLCTQREEGLWCQNEFNIDYQTKLFSEKCVNLFPLSYIFVIQLLSLRWRPSDITLRIFQRFCYQWKRMNTALGSYLRLLLTIVLDTTNLRSVSEYTKDFFFGEVTATVALSDLSFADILRVVLGRMNVLCLSEVADNFLNIRWAPIIMEILGEVATPIQVRDVKFYTVKDDAVWHKYVNLYSFIIDDRYLEILHDRYRLMRRRSSPPVTPEVYSLPPSKLDYYNVSPVFSQALPLLLHTDAAAIPALLILSRYNEQVQRPESADAEEVVTTETLLHAVTILYLSVCHSMAISDRREQGKRQEEGAEKSEIDWDYVEEFLEKNEVHKSSYTNDSIAAFTLLSGFCGSASVRELLSRSVDHFSPAIVLHELRHHFKENPSKDKFSFVTMIEYILIQTSLAQFEVDTSVNPEKDSEPTEEEMRLRRIRAKRDAIMQKLKSKKAFVDPGCDSEDLAPGENVKLGVGVVDTLPSSALLFTQIVSVASEPNCCICRLETEEPLALFMSRVETPVLTQLGFRDGSRTTLHVSSCGHVGHYSCVGRLTKSANYFRCPLCLASLNTVSLLPCIDEYNDGSTIFNAIRNSTQQFTTAILADTVSPLVIPPPDYIRCIHDGLILLLENVKAGHNITMTDLLVFASLLTSCPTSENCVYSPGNFEELITECLRLPGDASLVYKSYTARMLSQVRSSCAGIDHSTNTNIWERVLDSSPSEIKDGRTRLFLLSLWTNLGFLSLLKMLVSDFSTESILSLSDTRQSFEFLHIRPEVLLSEADTVVSVRKLVAYLLESDDIRDVLDHQVADQEVFPELAFTYKSLDTEKHFYESPPKWCTLLAENILCFPGEYLELLNTYYSPDTPCVECTLLVSQKALCCYCYGLVCIDAQGLELIEHSKKCMGKNSKDKGPNNIASKNMFGLFLHVAYSLVIGVNPELNRFCYVPSFYVDRYGEVDEGILRRRPLFISEPRLVEFFHLWLGARWCIEEKVLRRSLENVFFFP